MNALGSSTEEQKPGVKLPLCKRADKTDNNLKTALLSRFVRASHCRCHMWVDFISNNFWFILCFASFNFYIVFRLY